MSHAPLVASIMIPFPHAVDAASTLARARRLMEEHEVRHLPVVEDAQLVGVLGERALAVAMARDGDDALVGDHCDRSALVVDLHRAADSLLDELADEHADAAIVVKEGRLAGIFTTVDACRFAADHVRRHWPGPGDDAA